MKHNSKLCVNTFLHFFSLRVLKNWGRARSILQRATEMLPPSPLVFKNRIAGTAKRLHQRVDIAVGATYIHAVPCHCRGGKNGPDGHHLLDARNHVVIEKVGESCFVVWSAV